MMTLTSRPMLPNAKSLTRQVKAKDVKIPAIVSKSKMNGIPPKNRKRTHKIENYVSDHETPFSNISIIQSV